MTKKAPLAREGLSKQTQISARKAYVRQQAVFRTIKPWGVGGFSPRTLGQKSEIIFKTLFNFWNSIIAPFPISVNIRINFEKDSGTPKFDSSRIPFGNETDTRLPHSVR